MKLLTILTLVFVLSLVAAWPRTRQNYERRRIIHHEHKNQRKHESGTKGIKHHNSKKNAHKIYKKFGMFAPGFSLEDNSLPVAQGQGQSAFQQVLVPVNSAGYTQNTAAAPEMLSRYTATPSQRATLGTEVVGDLQSTTQQQITTQAAQPQTLQMEGGLPGTNEDNSILKTTQGATLQEAPIGTSEDNSVLKTATQGETLQEAGTTPTELVRGQATAIGPGTESIQSFTQQQPGKGTDELKDLQMYSGPLPDSGQNKPQVEGVSPQEEIKIVNLGDDEKIANVQQDHSSCPGGCPPGAKCVSGQCQIREEDAQAQGLTGKEGTANNPGSVSDIHKLETQELASLLKDASNADTVPGAVPETESPVTGSSVTPAGNPSGVLLDHTPAQNTQSNPQQQKIQTRPKIVQFTKPASTQQTVTTAQQPATSAQPHFNGDQLKELRDFARMYKMYQFIRKMEERLNDPDCAPVCRKTCKTFCPAKCCHGHKVSANVVSHMMQTADKVEGTENKVVAPVAKQQKVAQQKFEGEPKVEGQPKVEAEPKVQVDPKVDGKQKFEGEPKLEGQQKLGGQPKVEEEPKIEGQQKVGASGMEDNAGEHGLTGEDEDKKMEDNAPGKKHILIRIVKNDVLDRPRSDIMKTT